MALNTAVGLRVKEFTLFREQGIYDATLESTLSCTSQSAEESPHLQGERMPEFVFAIAVDRHLTSREILYTLSDEYLHDTHTAQYVCVCNNSPRFVEENATRQFVLI